MRQTDLGFFFCFVSREMTLIFFSFFFFTLWTRARSPSLSTETSGSCLLPGSGEFKEWDSPLHSDFYLLSHFLLAM